jgi:hypothetical protein
MGRKDHLGTPEEDYKRRTRELKKVTSTVTQGNPPVFTRGLNQAGIVGKTQTEVRDTDFPILFDIDDQTQNLLVSPATTNIDYIIDLSKQEAHYHRLKIVDVDDSANPVTNINVFFTNLAKNKEIQFTIEWIKDPLMVATPTINISPILEGTPAQPTPFPDDFDVWYFLVSGRTLPDNTTRYELINFGTGSGTGNTFPILYPEENIGSIAGPTQNINISGTNGQDKKMTLTGNVNLTFSGFPAATLLEEFWLVVTQDAIGGHNLTATGSTLKNQGLLNSLVDKTPLSQSIINFVTADGGATIHAELVDLVAGGGGGFTGLLSSLTIDVSKDWAGFSISNLAGIDLFANGIANSVSNADVVTFISNAAASRGQIGRSDFFGTAQGLTLNITANDNFVFSVDTAQKVKFDDAADLISIFSYDLHLNGRALLLDADKDTKIQAGTDDVMQFTTGGSLRMSMSNSSLIVLVPTTLIGNVDIISGDLDMGGGNIIDTGNITVNVGTFDIGDATNSFTDIFAQYFRPNGAAPTTKDGYTKVGTNRQLISYDSGTADSGFGIYEDGIQKFLFNILPTNVITLFIGGDPFTPGEEYRIQLGENGGSAARISFKEGGGTDLILNREGIGTTRGVQLQSSGLSRLIATSTSIKMFEPVDMNNEDVINVDNIFSNDDSPNNQIGDSVVGVNPGGFNYFVSERITWEGDFDTYIEMNGSAISVVSDDNLILAAGDDMILSAVGTANWFIGSSTGLNLYVGGVIKMTIQDNALVTQSGVDHILFGSSNILMNEGFIEIDDFGGNPPTPLGTKGRMFNKVDSETLAQTPFWIDPLGTITSMLSGSGGGGGVVEGTSIVKTADEDRINQTTLEIDDEMKFIPEADKVYFIELDIKYHSESQGMKVAIQGGNDMTYQIVQSNIDINGRLWLGPSLSNGDFVVLNSSPSTDVLGSVFAIIQVNSQIDEVGISYAQVNGFMEPTTMMKGSCLRVFGEGVNSGGGGTQGTVENIVISTAPSNFSNNEGHEDTNAVWFGDGNADTFIGLVLGDSNPGSPMIEHTLTAANFPTGTVKGITVTGYGGINFSCEVHNTSGINGDRFVVQVYVNGVAQFSPEVSIGLPINNNTSGGGLWIQTGSFLNIGDRIGFAVWKTPTAATITLEHWLIQIFPTNAISNDDEIHHLMITNFNDTDDEDRQLNARTPSGLTGGVRLSDGAVTNFIINGMGGNPFPFFEFPDIILQGAVYDGNYGGFNAQFSGSFSIINRVRTAYGGPMNEYQVLTKIGDV